MNNTKEMKKVIAKIIGKAYKSCVKAERRAAKVIIKMAGKRTADWNKEHVTISKKYKSLQRNELCPCNDNMKLFTPKKYKNCCQLVIHNREQAVYEDIYAQRRLKDVIDNASDDSSSPLILPDSFGNNKAPSILIP